VLRERGRDFQYHIFDPVIRDFAVKIFVRKRGRDFQYHIFEIVNVIFRDFCRDRDHDF
jgi:hypothetical protein